jgi:hypothetical protein
MACCGVLLCLLFFWGALRTLIMSIVDEEDSEVLPRFCIVGLY